MRLIDDGVPAPGGSMLLIRDCAPNAASLWGRDQSRPRFASGGQVFVKYGRLRVGWRLRVCRRCVRRRCAYLCWRQLPRKAAVILCSVERGFHRQFSLISAIVAPHGGELRRSIHPDSFNRRSYIPMAGRPRSQEVFELRLRPPPSVAGRYARRHLGFNSTKLRPMPQKPAFAEQIVRWYGCSGSMPRSASGN